MTHSCRIIKASQLCIQIKFKLITLMVFEMLEIIRFDRFGFSAYRKCQGPWKLLTTVIAVSGAVGHSKVAVTVPASEGPHATSQGSQVHTFYTQTL